MYRDAGTKPSLGFLRLRLGIITFGDGDTRARLRVFVTGRALGPGAPARVQPAFAAPFAARQRPGPPNLQPPTPRGMSHSLLITEVAVWSS